MSNPGVLLLDDGVVDGKVVRIEDNLGESIHIHVDDFRFSFTNDEFIELYKAIDIAACKLFELEGLKWKIIDKSSLDWDWISDYENISSIIMTTVRLDELYTVKQLSTEDRIQKIIKLSDSDYVKVLKGELISINLSYEKNNYGVTSLDRLFDIKRIVEKKGYPYDNKLIMIDDNNRIYDGDHRAACLYSIYGGNYIIPVLQVVKKNQISLRDEIINNKKKNTIIYLKKQIKQAVKCPLKLLSKVKSSFELNYNKQRIINKKYCFDNIIAYLKKRRISYFLFDRKIVNDNKIISKTLFVKDLTDFEKAFPLNSDIIYSQSLFLYSSVRPYLLVTDIGNVMVWDRMCCKSKFENAFLPLDKRINEYMWKVADNSVESENCNNIVMLIYIITNCMLEKNMFRDEDVEFLKNNKKLLYDNQCIELLKTIFFGYTEAMIKDLIDENYEKCIIGYVKNNEY